MSIRHAFAALFSGNSIDAIVARAGRSIARSRRHRKRMAVGDRALGSLEGLETRILFGVPYLRGTDVPYEGPVFCPSCGGGGPIVEDAGGGVIPGELEETFAPVRYASGAPILDSADLTSDAFGMPWGHVRRWTGLNEGSQNGNGWMVRDLPYLTVAMTQNPNFDHGSVVSVVQGGQSVHQYRYMSSSASQFAIPNTPAFGDPLSAAHGTLEYVPPAIHPITSEKLPGEFRLTDTTGNVTTFYDLPRNQSAQVDPDGKYYGWLDPRSGYTQEVTQQWFDTSVSGGTGFYSTTGVDPYRFGAFKSWTDASGKLTVTTDYDSSGNLTEVVRTDGSGAFERFFYEYNTWTNTAVTPNATASLIGRVTLQKGASSTGPWTSVRSAEYDYYTGNDAGETKQYGRLGDLKHVVIKDYQRNSLGDVVDQKYYRYNKLTGYSFSENSGSDGYNTRGPTNYLATTGGADGTFPTETNDSAVDNAVMSGLKAVFEGAAYDRLATARGDITSFQDDLDSDLFPYANNTFAYERVDPSDGASAYPHYTTNTRYRVVAETAAADGCSTCSSGMGNYRYDYAVLQRYNLGTFEGMFFDNRAAVHMKSTEYLPDATNAMVSSTLGTGALTSSGTTATVTLSGHGYSVGEEFTVSGATPSGYNGTFKVTAVTANTFTYTLASSLTSPATGTIVVASLRRIDPDQWQDNDTNVVYTNGLGEAMYAVYTDRHGTSSTSDDRQYVTAYEYDAMGRLTKRIHPSAVSSFSEVDGYPTLTVQASQGVIENYYYAGSSTSGLGDGDLLTDINGAVEGMLDHVTVQRGSGGGEVWLQSTTYYEKSYGGSTIHPIARTTEYFDTDGDTDLDPVDTRYTYGWRLDGSSVATNRAAWMTTTLPAVAIGHNGSGTANAVATFYDAVGRPIWTKDADGFIHYREYDNASGAVKRQIVDVKYSSLTTAEQTSFAATGWSQPSVGQHLVTDYVVDGLGRPTKMTDPAGHVTYTVYKDADHEVRTYRGWTGSAATGPTEVVREDRAHNYTEVLTMSATPAVSSSAPTGSESIGSVQSLSRSIVNNAGQVLSVDEYHSFSGTSYSASSATLGSSGTNYNRTEYAYDQRGRLKKVKNAVGTIRWSVYDGLGRLVSTWIGTDDTGAINGDPDGPGGNSNNMLQTAAYEYDGGSSGGDGNLTKVTEYVGNGDTDRVTLMGYDWRDRLVATKYGDQGGSGENTGVNRQLQYVELDNLGRQTAVEWYDADQLSISSTSGVPNKPSYTLRTSRSETNYDEQGRVYQTKAFSDPSTSSPSAPLVANTWYDARDNVIKTKAPTGLVTKLSYDGAGRISKRFSTDDNGETDYSAVDDVAGDAVLEQTEYTYDANGNVILTTTRQRFHDATATDELGNRSSSSGTAKARVSYVASYYDAADRLVAELNVGTAGGSGFTRPTTAPTYSDTAVANGTQLLSTYTYDAAGRLWKTTNPEGHEDRTTYDLLGRVTKTVENYVDGTPSDADDRTTQYTYTGIGQVETLTAVLPDGPDSGTELDGEMTYYYHGVSVAGGSRLNSNDLLAGVYYPDPSVGWVTYAAGTYETYSYLRNGDLQAWGDRNHTVFYEMIYDVMGRRTLEYAGEPSTGQGVDYTVRALGTEFDPAGRPYRFTTTDGDFAVLNQVQREFDGLGRLTAEYTNAGGSVNTSTTPKVQYSYDDAHGGRLSSMTYPNGRVLHYGYNTGVDTGISRVSFLADDNGSNAVGTHLEDYSYLGLGTIVDRWHPESELKQTYIYDGTGSSTGDGGDQYVGLDRFGRVVNQNAVIYDADEVTDVIDRYTYTYDRDSNRLSRGWANTSGKDEAYTYDNLNRLSKMNRGMLASGTITDSNATYSQNWTSGSGTGLDALGNWRTATTDTNGGASGGSTTQSRTHNFQNELTGIDSNSLTYDNNGNMRTDENGNTLTYDAWNRLVQVKDSGNNVIVSYEYDALGRRIAETKGSTTRDFFYSAGWQVLEEREGSTVKAQNVWSLAYVDAMVLRDGDATSGGNLGKSGSGLDERLYAVQDANFNVTAVVDTSGVVVERYQYDPYGSFKVLDANFSVDSDGASDVGWAYLHQGGRFDETTDLYSFRNRDYSPTLGRWIQPDPLDYVDSLNVYSAMASNPQSKLDPTGLCCDKSKKKKMPKGFQGAQPTTWPSEDDPATQPATQPTSQPAASQPASQPAVDVLIGLAPPGGGANLQAPPAIQLPKVPPGTPIQFIFKSIPKGGGLPVPCEMELVLPPGSSDIADINFAKYKDGGPVNGAAGGTAAVIFKPKKPGSVKLKVQPKNPNLFKCDKPFETTISVPK